MSRDSAASERFVRHDDEGAYFDWLSDHFGVDRATFAGHRIWKKEPSGSLWLADAGVDLVPGLPYEVVGVRLERAGASVGQLSSAFMRRFLGTATRRVIDLSGADVDTFLAGESFEPSVQYPNGYYVVRLAGEVAGRGRVHDGVLHSELPRQERLARERADG